MALNGGIRSGFKLLASSEAAICKSASENLCLYFFQRYLGMQFTLSRGFHATGVKRMGGHGHNEPYYLHAKHMYNLDRLKHQKLKMSLAVLSAFSIGVAVPVYAVIFQQKKTSSA
ncbi:hypothetical protein DsansV1_C08g0085471 [Dioscorea sansibarensis]